MKPWLEQRRTERPDGHALSVDGVDYSYAWLADRAARRATTLVDLGVEPGARIAIAGTNSLDYVLWAHAVFWLGATLVPLHPREGRERLADQCELIEPEMVLVLEPDIDFETPTTTRVVDTSDIEALVAGEPRCAPADVSTDNVLTIMFTSGTSGAARAVPLTVGNHQASALASARRLGCQPDEHWLCCLPLCHIGGLAIVLRSAIYGTSFELLERFDEEAVIEALTSRRVTLASFVPTMLRRLLDVADTPLETHLRAVLVGGGYAPVEELEEARQLGLPVLPTYGMTEAASQIATLAPAEANDRLDTAGRPLDGAEIRIADPHQPEDPGRSGTIFVRGPMVTAGYIEGGASSDDSFTDGWLDTGDVGQFDADGYLVVEHRKGERITSGGETVHPAEIERVLRGLPQIVEAAVAGLDDADWGQCIGAAVVASPSEGDESALCETLETHCRAHLAPFKVPRRWMFVEEIPKTSSGKVRRNLIRRLFHDPRTRSPDR